jgi:hypothetical protein
VKWGAKKDDEAAPAAEGEAAAAADTAEKTAAAEEAKPKPYQPRRFMGGGATMDSTAVRVRVLCVCVDSGLFS